ncbi:peptidoglycan DD-metalloendopeptidase family protein [Clostridium cylindrosporum]|uniref:Peptidase M23B n=1 Tax=Clostridium cylindrosporum DSM 605 TaxID=1121307 RepID=A0A0J8G299_CLOCY|nr:peptidoglycan DD-metalloendopeptidase family protein [Clostridium cylindrosporum]KMT21866.1 peptidase M23B [Clostridium cylindrosporum DSM 605]
MRRGKASRRGSSIAPKVIATAFLLITIAAMIVIVKMPNETFMKVLPDTVKTNINVLKEEISALGEEKEGAVETGTKPVVNYKVPDSMEARKERAETYLETALLTTITRSVKTSTTINHKVEVIKTAALKKGEKKIITKGQDGLKEINKELTYKGDELTESEVVSTKTVKKVVNEVILQGIESKVPILMVPAKGRYSSFYGERWNRMHKGVDIAGPVGTPIKAAEGGEVVFSGDRGTYGKCVIIKHINGYETLYAHNSKLIAKQGDKVDKGEIISELGNTGRSTGPHLHFEVKVNGKQIDPMSYLKK